MNLDGLDAKQIVDRILEAYGFSTKVALAEKFNISPSTIANRLIRNTFPGDFVIRCALETGASLRWLVTGEGVMYDDGKKEFISIEKIILEHGELSSNGFLLFDPAFLPNHLQSPQCVISNKNTYIVDKNFTEIADGKWLIDIEGKMGIYTIERIPVKKLRVSGGGLKMPFECNVDDISILAKVTCTTIQE